MSSVGPDIDYAFAEAGDPYQQNPLNSTSRAYEIYRQVLSGQGCVFGFSAYNSDTSSGFVLVFDSSQLPASGATADVSFAIGTAANLGVNWIPARWFRNGCWLYYSTTSPTLTAGTAKVFFDAQYL